MDDTTDWQARALAAEAKLDAIAATLRDLPAPKPDARKVVALIDVDGDRWKRLGADAWSLTSTYAKPDGVYRTRESVNATYGPVTEVYEDNL